MFLLFVAEAGVLSDRSTFLGILKNVVVCLFSPGIFLKASTAISMMLNGQNGESLSTFLNFQKISMLGFDGRILEIGGNSQVVSRMFI